MFRYVLGIFTLFFLFAFAAFDQGTICLNPIDHQISINLLRKNLIGGEWQYDHSAFKDTCFVIDDLTTLPKSMTFENRADSSFIQDKKRWASRTNAYFRDMACTVIENGSGRKILTFPAGSGKIPVDSLIDGLPMFHLPALNSSGMTRKVYYDLLSVEADTMIARTGVVVAIHGKGEWNIHHVFYRKPLP